jgi:glycosyltransferase involved in cell wall biosynthesis
MRIAFISQPRDFICASGTQRGSVGIVTWELARRLASRHEVTIYAPLGPGQALEEQGGGVLVRRIPGAHRRMHRALELGSTMLGARTPYFTRRFYFPEYIRAVIQQIQRDPPDCLHVQVASQFLPDLRRAAPDAFIALHTHDELLTRIDPAPLERRLAAANAVVTCSDYVTRQWRKRFTAHAHRITTIGNGVDLMRFQPTQPCTAREPEGRPRCSREILYVGRVSPEKGVHLLATAFGQVLRTCPDAKLLIVGPAGLLPLGCISPLVDDHHVASLREFYGTGLVGQFRCQVLRAKWGYVEAIRSRLSKEALTHVQIVGQVEFNKLPDLYRHAGVLAAPSLMEEPFGLPVVEALASGLPVVASRAGGMGDLVDDGVTGRVVERGDASQLAEAICELFSDPERMARMSTAARAAATSRYGWEEAVARLEAVYATRQ